MTTGPNHADRKHSELSASSSYRWLNCPGSVAAIRGLPNESTPAAEEGTAAHELANMCLVNGQDAIEYVGRVVHAHEVDEEMAEGVQVYLDAVRYAWHGPLGDSTMPDTRWIEQRFTLAALNPPAPMFGTADSVCYVTGHGTLYVHDLKFGKGHRVEAEGNPQLRYYALGALLSLQETHPTWRVSKIVATIVQPRQPAAGSDPVRSTEIDPLDLMEWALDLVGKAHAAMEPKAPLVAGPWCADTFCPNRGPRCPAASAYALEAARLEFGPFVDQESTPAPADTRTLTPAQLGALLSRLDALEAWCKDARALAASELAAGRPVEGWKLVESEADRDSWVDATVAEATLQLVHEVDPYEPRKVLSPAKARDLIAEGIRARGEAKTKKAAVAAARLALRPLMYRKQGTKLVPATDPRPALTGDAAVLFPALPAPSTDQSE